MKKLFLFTVALLTCLMVGANTYTLEPGENKIETAIASAQAGDVIELTGDADNVYTEWHSITIDKAITLRAAEGATPVVHMPKIKMHADFEVEGVEFYGFSDYLFITETGGDFSISFRNCVLRDNPAYFIYICENQSVNALTIDNCIFKDNTKNEQPVVYGRGTIGNFEMRNSTVINCPGSYPVRIYSSESIIVDHCTFVNVGKQALRLAETTRTATTIAVSNCVIFSETATDDYAYYLYNGTLTNSVYYNSPSPGYRSGLTVTKIINADPLFADPENGDFNFSVFSPLCFAATDGTHIGDPRWTMVSEEGVDLPATLDKSNVGATSADMTYYGESDEYFDFGPEKSQENKSRWASWVVNIEKGTYKVTADVEDVGVGYNLQLEIINTTTGNIDKTFATEWKVADFGTLNLCDLTSGQYIVRLKNTLWGGQVKVKSLTFEYTGGAVVDAGLLPNDDAVLVGKVARDENNNIKSSGRDDVPTAEFFYWNVNFEKAGYYAVAMNVAAPSEGSASGHYYHIYLNNDEQAITEETQQNWEASACILTVSPIRIATPGIYVVKVINTMANSSALFNSLSFTYAGGAVIEVPATLPNEEALLTGSKISRTADGIAWGDNIDVTEDYATWNISVAEGGDYLVTMAVKTGETSGHEFFIKIFNGDSQQVGETITETTKTPINLAAGTYTVHLGNNRQWSSAVMASVAIKSASGTVVDMPGTLQADDALLGGDDEAKVDGDGYICFSKGEKVPNCWATWQTNWVKTGTYDVIMDVNATNGHQLVVEVLDGETVIETFEHGYSEESGKLSIGKFKLSETKSYTIRLTNKQDWSDARIKSIAFIPFITIGNDDTEVDFTAYEGQIVTIKLNRTFKANMYNPICLPFALSSAALQNILKSEKSYVLGSASLEEHKLYVELQEGNDIYQGTPNMIKPSEDVENPVFTNVEIKTISPDQTTRGVLRLQGSFACHTINPQTALLVGANNTLFFPNDETPYIKSMRAYFILQGVSPANMPKSACFREPGNAPTWMPIVGAETEKPNGKFIRNGRFVIVREGKEYGILGVEK